MSAIYTVGYAHWSAAALAQRLEAMDAVLFDIRFRPSSRRPEWCEDALRTRLDWRYVHAPQWGNQNYRGGPIQIAHFQAGLEALAVFRDNVHEGRRPFVLMCGCADYATCHRSVVADMLRDRGYTVEELSPGDSPSPMRALSLWQPWASLVAWGEKRLETRDWATPYRGLLAIHATKAFPDDARWACQSEPFRSVLVAHGITTLADLPRGAVVAVCDLVSVNRTDWRWASPDFASPLSDYPPQERRFGDFSAGRYAWELANVRLLPEPVPCRGAMGLWTPDSDTVSAVLAQAHQAEAV